MEKYIIARNYFDGYSTHNSDHVFVINDGMISENYDINGDKVKELLKKDNAVDYRDKFVTPGLIDSHNHFTLTSLKLKYQVNFSSVRSFSQFLEMLENNRDKVIHRWFQGYAINEYDMEEKQLPDRLVIDTVFPDTPVFITQMTEHYGICNSKALELAGVSKETESPPNGKIGRYENGEPNGILYEANAMDLVKKMIPEYDINDYMEAIKFGAGKYKEAGISTVKDMGGTGKDVNEDTRVAALNRLSDEGCLELRVALVLPVYSLEDVKRKIELWKKVHESSRLKFSGFKMFMDGSILSRTAWMRNNYAKPENTDNKGIPLWDIENFRKALGLLSQTGQHISIHTIGDRAIVTALDAIEEVKKYGKSSTYSLVHCYKLDKDIIKRIKTLNVGVETQLAFIYFIGDGLTENIGKEQSRCLFPVKTLMMNSIPVSNGSDSPVTPFNPVYGLYSSIFRKTYTGNHSEIYSGREELTLEETLKTYTSQSSLTVEWDNIGVLGNNHFSDFSIWDKNPSDLGNKLNPWLNMKINAISVH
ncbi:MAG: amidohydrolase family protein [Ferroplasma sp.]|uniref:amidohydrolase n=1 Tax=Ferroplasma sp. TaxID=2591003 RepID=UPI0028153A62|nr:amidohydrolase family protein [Ferroplasma sp.]WMT50953.1 MAG: amidohydrolase family protein [Ferroplasma sp.]